MNAELTVLADPQALAQYAAHWLTERALAAAGAFTIALSGGSTPRLLYTILAAPPLAERFPWARAQLFWGDERCVPHDDPASNYRMTREALLAKVPIPAANVHPMPTDGDPADAAARYQRSLQDHYGAKVLSADRPLFDVVLLGLGENGHTASLFPATPALDEFSAWVVAVTSGVPQPRLTLTYPAIASSREVVFLVAGAAKRGVLAAVRAGDPSLPASQVTSAGQVRFFADRDAAG